MGQNIIVWKVEVKLGRTVLDTLSCFMPPELIYTYKATWNMEFPPVVGQKIQFFDDMYTFVDSQYYDWQMGHFHVKLRPYENYNLTKVEEYAKILEELNFYRSEYDIPA